MPQRNVIREFAPDMTYHCYNRGVEQRDIFLDEQDYGAFLQRLKLMLEDPSERKLKDEATEKGAPGRIRLKSFHGDVTLLAYCLMPNHFHVLLHQHTERGVTDFMRTLSTSYTMYFNTKYKRVGSLFQGRYKARRVDNAVYGVHISRYIHLNALHMPGSYEKYEYASMQFLAEPHRKPGWVHVEQVLDDFGGSYDAYHKFLAEYASPDDFEYLEDKFDLA